MPLETNGSRDELPGTMRLGSLSPIYLDDRCNNSCSLGTETISRKIQRVQFFRLFQGATQRYGGEETQSARMAKVMGGSVALSGYCKRGHVLPSTPLGPILQNGRPSSCNEWFSAMPYRSSTDEAEDHGQAARRPA